MTERAFDEGVEKGRNRGIHDGRVNLLRAVLDQRFGTWPEPFVERPNSISAEKFVTVKSLNERGVE